MRGKAGLVIGIAVGYVLGTRAGRERYEQIKAQALKLWELEPVQNQVDKAKDFGKSAVMSLPVALWDGAVKVTKAAQSRGSAGERFDAAMAAGKGSADDIARAAETSSDAVAAAAADAAAKAKKAAEDVAKKSAVPGPPPGADDATPGASGPVGPGK